MMRRLTSTALTILLAACSSTGIGPSPSARRAYAADENAAPTTTPIKHVVFVIQENRSFNNLFMGYPGALTASSGYDSHGHKVTVTSRKLDNDWDPGHNADDFFVACDGQGKLRGTKCKMDGWDLEPGQDHAPKDLAYSHVPKSEIVPYWEIARQYVLADHMFASNLDGSFVAHQYLVAAFAGHTVDYPYGPWGCEGGSVDTVPTLTKKRKIGKPVVPCFTYPTLANELDAAKLNWRFYSDNIQGLGGLWSSYQADESIYDGPDWNADVVTPPSNFLSDVKHGKLAAITWITPIWRASDHPGTGEATQGPAWVASVANAIGASKFWDSTALFIMWDDWGGWFDPVKPPYKDYDGLGFRVGLLVVSPYAKRGSVTHVQYETASVLRFMEDNFNLGRLSDSDARAKDPAGDPATFDFAQKPRAFKKIAGGKPAAFWMQLEREPAPPREDGRLGD